MKLPKILKPSLADEHTPTRRRRPPNKKLLTWIIGGGVVVIGLGMLINFWFGKPRLYVTATPSQAQTFVNELPYKRGMRLNPGQAYRIFVGAPGYRSVAFSVTGFRFKPIVRQLTLTRSPDPVGISQGLNALYVNRTTNQLIALAQEGRAFQQIQLLPNNNYAVTAISREIVPELKEAPTLSPDFQLAVFRQKNGSTGLFDFKLYDLLRQELHDWGPNIGDVAWRSDSQRLVYIYELRGGERTIMKTDRDRAKTERIFDLRPEGIVDPTLEWSADQKIIAMVSNGNLYFLDPLAKVLTKVVTGGVTSALLSPTSRQVAYTQNGQLYLLSYDLINPFSKSEQDQKNIGRVIIDAPVSTNLAAQASASVFSKNGDRLVTIVHNHAVEIFTNTGFSHELTGNEGGTINAVQISNDGNHLYVVINGVLYDWFIQ